MDLRLHSPVGAAAISYPWPEEPVSRHARALEIMETIRWVCEDLPDLKPALENNILCGVRTTDRASVQEMCRKYNRTIDSIVSLEKGTSLPARRIKKLPSRGLLRHILQQCYNRAVTEPQKLNLYEAFSESVYGETSFEVICQMVEELKVSDQDVFIDLGSGIGQIVLQMAASSACKLCYGIEKCDIPNTYAENMSMIFQKWLHWYGKKSGKYELLKGDFLSENFQEKINSATIIFANNFAFGPTLDHQLKQRFAELRDGTRIVSSKNFCSLNFRMTERNMSDIGAIMNVLNNKITGAVSWTDKPIPYYIQIIDRSKLARYFESKKSPKLTSKYCSDSSGESDLDTSSDFECSPFKVKVKKANNPSNQTDAPNVDIKVQIDSHSRSPFLHNRSPSGSPKIGNEQDSWKHTNICSRSPFSGNRSPKFGHEQVSMKAIDIHSRSSFSSDESPKLTNNPSSINPSDIYNRCPFSPSRSPDSKFDDAFTLGVVRHCGSQGSLNIRVQSPISYKYDTNVALSNPKDYRSRNTFSSNRHRNKHSKKSIARRKSLDHGSPFRSPKCKSRKLERNHENDDRLRSPKHKSKSGKRNINKNHINYSDDSHNETNNKISEGPKSENQNSNYNLRHVNVKYASETDAYSDFDDDIPKAKSKSLKREVHLKKPVKTCSKKYNVDKKKYLNDFENFFQNVTSPKSVQDNKVHLRRNAKYDLELVDNGDNINRIRLKRFYKNMQSPVSDSESDREVQLKKASKYKPIENEIVDLNEAESPHHFTENVTENLYKKSPKYYAESVIQRNPNTIELSESEKRLINITSPNRVQNEYSPFIESKFNISRNDLSECESPKSASEVLSPLYTSKLMIQGNMNKIRLIKKRRHPKVIESLKTENQEDWIKASPSTLNSKCVENITFDVIPVSPELENTNISNENVKSVNNSNIGAKRRKSKPKKKVRSPSPFDNVDCNNSFVNVLTENKIPQTMFDPKTEFLSDNSIDYVQKPVFLSDNSNLESLHSHCEDSNSNFEVSSKANEQKCDPEQNCLYENVENAIPNLGNEEEGNICCRVTRRRNKRQGNVKEITKTDTNSPETNLCRKPKKTGIRKTKRKKVYNIEGLDLLHEKTMHSISSEEIKKYKRPPFGCIEEELSTERRQIQIGLEQAIKDNHKISTFGKNSLETSTNILCELSENFESSQNSKNTNHPSHLFSVQLVKNNENMKDLTSSQNLSYVSQKNDVSKNSDCMIINSDYEKNMVCENKNNDCAKPDFNYISKNSDYMVLNSTCEKDNVVSKSITAEKLNYGYIKKDFDYISQNSDSTIIHYEKSNDDCIKKDFDYSSKNSDYVKNNVVSKNIAEKSIDDCVKKDYDYSSKNSDYVKNNVVSKNIAEKSNYDCVKKDLDYSSKNSNYYSSQNEDCEILNNTKVNYDVKPDLYYGSQNCDYSKNDDNCEKVNYDCHERQFERESKLSRNKTESTAKFDDVVKNEPPRQNKPNNHTQDNSTKYSNVSQNIDKSSELSDVNVTSQSDTLQRLLNAYRQQFLQMVHQMSSPGYRKHIETQISTEKNRNMLLNKKVSQLTLEIQGLLSNGTSLLRCHLHNLNIKPTPRHVLIAGKQIVHRNINLRDTANKLQADLIGLETEKDRLVEKRSEEILECDGIDLNENLIYVEVILAQAKEMIFKNRDLKEKCYKLEEQLDILEKHQSYILSEQAKEIT